MQMTAGKLSNDTKLQNDTILNLRQKQNNNNNKKDKKTSLKVSGSFIPNIAASGY